MVKTEIDNAELQLELLDLRSNEDLRDVYQEQSLHQFYLQLQEDTYPVLLKNARFWIAFSEACTSMNRDFLWWSLINLNKLDSQPTDGLLDAIMRIAIMPLKPNISCSAEKNACKKVALFNCIVDKKLN